MSQTTTSNPGQPQVSQATPSQPTQGTPTGGSAAPANTAKPTIEGQVISPTVPVKAATATATATPTPAATPAAPMKTVAPSAVTAKAVNPALTPSGSSQVRIPIAGAAVSPGYFQVTSAVDPSNYPYLNMLVYGEPGVGKTTLCASAVDIPSMNDVLVITAEGGNMSLEDNDRVKRAEFVDEVRIVQIEQFQKVYEFLRAHCVMRIKNDEAGMRKLQDQVMGSAIRDPERLRKYKTVIIDSLTEIEFQNMNKVLGLNPEDLGLGDDAVVADYGVFRKNNNAIQRSIRNFRDLPMNVLIVCAIAWTQDELKRFSYAPSITGKLAQQIQGFVDVVGYMAPVLDVNTGGTVVRLYVRPIPAPKFQAKNRRAGCKKPHMDNPTMLTLMKDLKFNID